MDTQTLVHLARQHGFTIEPVEESSRYALVPKTRAKPGFPRGLLTLKEIVSYLQSLTATPVPDSPILRVCLLQQPAAIVIQSNPAGLAALAAVVDDALQDGSGQAAVQCQVRDSNHPIMLYCTSGISPNSISFAEPI